MVEFLKLKNNAKTTLSADLSSDATSMTVTSPSVFPTTGNFHLTIWDMETYSDPGDDPSMEIVKVTDISGSELTISRGQENTASVAHSSGHEVELLLTTGVLEDIEAQIQALTSDDIADGTTNKQYTATEKSKLSGIEEGAEVNNISDEAVTDLTDGEETTLHKHSYTNLNDKPTIPDELSDLSEDASHRLVTDTEKSTWNGKQDSLTPDLDYLTPDTASSTYEPKKGSNDNYVTDDQVTILENTSGSNSGDETESTISSKLTGNANNIIAIQVLGG